MINAQGENVSPYLSESADKAITALYLKYMNDIMMLEA